MEKLDYKRYLTELITIVIIIALAVLPLFFGEYFIIFFINIFVYIILTLSWSIFSGPTGYISLASAAFFGAGIYISAMLGKMLPFPLLIITGGIVSFILAFLIGRLTLRLRGMYFAVFTFGITELLRNFILWYEANFSHTVGRWVVSADNYVVYYTILIIGLLTILTAYLIHRSRVGLALRSIGDQEEASAHIGVGVNMLKSLIFATSAFFMGAVGVAAATRWTYIDPRIAFNALYSFMPVLMAIFGGLGQLWGPILGAALLSYLAELLITKFPYYYMLLFGLILIIVIRFIPGGLASILKKIAGKKLKEHYADT